MNSCQQRPDPSVAEVFTCFVPRPLCCCVQMVPFVCSAVPSASKILAVEALISVFSALLLKDPPGEAAAQDDPLVLLEDSRGPEGKAHQSPFL